MNEACRRRRGMTILETMLATAILGLSIVGLANLMSNSASAELKVLVQSDTDRIASQAMGHLMAEVREAKRVTVLAGHRFQLFYPVIEYGWFNRFYTNWSGPVEYFRGDAAAQHNAAGSFLWKRNSAGATILLARHVNQFQVNTISDSAIQVTLEIRKTRSGAIGSTQMSNRILYLRNH